MNRIIIPTVLLGMAIFAFSGCQSNPGGSQFVSVVPVGDGETDGMAKMANWKAHSEALAKRAPDSAQVSYETARNSANQWINQKIVRSQGLANQNFGTVRLDASSVSHIEPVYKQFVAKADSKRLESATTALALTILRKLAAAGKKSRADSATILQAQLELLRWKDWDEIRG